MPKKKLERIDNLLQKTINKAGIAKQVQAAQICDSYHEALLKTGIREEAVEKSKAIIFRNGILTVAVIGSSWAQELQMRQHLIVERINSKMGKDLVNRIIFQIA